MEERFRAHLGKTHSSMSSPTSLRKHIKYMEVKRKMKVLGVQNHKKKEI